MLQASVCQQSVEAYSKYDVSIFDSQVRKLQTEGRNGTRTAHGILRRCDSPQRAEVEAFKPRQARIAASFPRHSRVT
jgi:hypothetical protein